MAAHDLRLHSRFIDHPPTDGQVLKHEAIRAAGREFAELLADLCPSSPELTLAINAVDLAVMQANAAVARH